MCEINANKNNNNTLKNVKNYIFMLPKYRGKIKKCKSGPPAIEYKIYIVRN